jgi:hypothetical protein
MTCHSEQMRVPSNEQITFRNTKFTHWSELRFLGTYITENIKWCANVQLLWTKLWKVLYLIKTIKETISPCIISNIYYSNIHEVTTF